jgi:putative copper resistance protein D
METAAIGLRLVQYLTGSALFGTALFLVYGFRGTTTPRLRWPRPLLAASAATLALAALLSLLVQTATMAGDPAAARDPELLGMVAGETAFGAATLMRAAAGALAAGSCLLLRAGRGLWVTAGGFGAVALATFAWTGHGAAEPGVAGLVHAAADVLHLLAAGLWMGALVAFAALLSGRGGSEARSRATHRALANFSGAGSLIVATLVLTGLVNSWFLVGPDRILDMASSTYGALLLVKLGLFAGMLGLAAYNRLRLTPALAWGLAAGRPSAPLGDLRRSVLIEFVVGFAVLGLVAVLGTLPPVSAS